MTDFSTTSLPAPQTMQTMGAPTQPGFTFPNIPGLPAGFGMPQGNGQPPVSTLPATGRPAPVPGAPPAPVQPGQPSSGIPGLEGVNLPDFMQNFQMPTGFGNGQLSNRAGVAMAMFNRPEFRAAIEQWRAARPDDRAGRLDWRQSRPDPRAFIGS